jgi:high-affinity iron transporter
VVALLAAVVLLAVSHFVLARVDAQRRVALMRDRLSRAVGAQRRRFLLGTLAFIAVYREAFETVLFLYALSLDSGASKRAVIGGATGAVFALGLAVYGMARLGARLRPGPILSVLGTLLCVLAAVLAGKGMRALQEAGVIGITTCDGPRVDWLGVFPTTETLVAQAAVLAAFAVIVLVARWQPRGAP